MGRRLFLEEKKGKREEKAEGERERRGEERKKRVSRRPILGPWKVNVSKVTPECVCVRTSTQKEWRSINLNNFSTGAMWLSMLILIIFSTNSFALPCFSSLLPRSSTLPFQHTLYLLRCFVLSHDRGFFSVQLLIGWWTGWASPGRKGNS